MNNYFYKYVNNHVTSEKLMYLFHNTSLQKLIGIFKNGELAKSHCKVFDDELLYLFYGRPAYKVSQNTKPCDMDHILPVCLIFNNISIPIKNIYPFDTGAFNNNLFSFIDSFSLEDFALGTSIYVAPKFVKAFFGTNDNYYHGCVKRHIRNGSTLEVNAYYSLLNQKSPTVYDDRKYTLECITDENISLKENLISIIIPYNAMSYPYFEEFLYKYNCKPIFYSTYKGLMPETYCVSILEKAKENFKFMGE